MEEVHILIAEDDADDRFLLQTAFDENGLCDILHFVENGLEVFDYLQRAKTGKSVEKIPHFILLDLNMPKKDGREVLKELKEDIYFNKIPVIIFSTTNNEIEIKRCYDLGADSYFTKPNSFEGLIKAVADLRNFWVKPKETLIRMEPQQ